MLAVAALAAVAAPSAVTVGKPVPAAFAAARVAAPDGTERTLGDAWRDRPAVLIFLRHFG